MKKMLQLLAVVTVAGVSVSAQWAGVPRSSVPRGADGRPNLSAPAPRLADGRPLTLRPIISAPRVTAVRHHSDAGSACARLPQNVPRVRMG